MDAKSSRTSGQSWTFPSEPGKRSQSSRLVRLTSQLLGVLHRCASYAAVFPSDDDPDLDNYAKGRKKKRHVGTCFQQQPTSSGSTFSDCLMVPQPKRERKLVRKVDSGDYFGFLIELVRSDDLVPEELKLPAQSALPSR
ncbi:hypothetical protein E4U59_004617 [Claviceps monticola]|nr:hypothetical protein E4U59_004617 [Claviceps monticola]